MPPNHVALWLPLTRMEDLEVRIRDGRVEVIDRRCWVELLSLEPGSAAAVGTVLAEQARRAGWTGDGHESGR